MKLLGKVHNYKAELSQGKEILRRMEQARIEQNIIYATTDKQT